MPRTSMFDSDSDEREDLALLNTRKVSNGRVKKRKRKSKDTIYKQDELLKNKNHNSSSAFPAVNEPLYRGRDPKPLPTKFRGDKDVLDFGLGKHADPMNVVHEEGSMKPPKSSKIVKTRRLPNEAIKFLTERQDVPRSPVRIELNLPMASHWLFNRHFRPVSPIRRSFVDDIDIDTPTLEDIWCSYLNVKMGIIQLSDAVWPLCCMANLETSKTPPTKRVGCAENLHNKSIFETGLERQIGENELRVLNQWLESEVLNSPHIDMEKYDLNGKEKKGNAPQKPRILDNEEVSFSNLTIGIEEERAIKEWINKEGLSEHYSDIDEYDMLFKLARDPEKNRDLLFDLLKPKDLIPQDKAAWKKFPPKVLQLAQKPDLVEPEPSLDNIPEKETPFIENNPEKPVILEVKDIKPLVPKPEDEADIQGWLQQCSETISQQLQLVINEDSSSKPASAEPEGIDFESEISKQQLQPRILGESNKKLSPESGWQNSFTVRLDDFEYIVDHNMTEFRDPQAKRIRSKWNQRFGLKSAENLRRCVLLPPLPVHLDKCLQRIRILRRPSRRNVEQLRLRVEMNFCKTYCKLSMNRFLNLGIAANTLGNAVYNRDIGVIQARYEASQIAWIWADGSVLIINGRSKAMLAETQRDIFLRISGRPNFTTDPTHKLLHLRLISCAHFPWAISLPEFTASSAICSEPNMKYVYYVDKTIPGVAARVHETGMIQVFAMTTSDADNILKILYPITANHRKATIDGIGGTTIKTEIIDEEYPSS
ncbi:uncharacterized protein LOC6738676 [Drosophila simulans]|uniref:Uncharacterized protein n=1 Tax=Drosophila simulans TaxID=7240 RepID=A0A0J9RY70_DROSI|nr:uncharacterized protein LOC6738676 [Drosophila simulans]KMZ00538.1 uncharacterized protein Dsimw501_GD14800 [Drosophila simulans]